MNRWEHIQAWMSRECPLNNWAYTCPLTDSGRRWFLPHPHHTLRHYVTWRYSTTSRWSTNVRWSSTSRCSRPRLSRVARRSAASRSSHRWETESLLAIRCVWRYNYIGLHQTPLRRFRDVSRPAEYLWNAILEWYGLSDSFYNGSKPMSRMITMAYHYTLRCYCCNVLGGASTTELKHGNIMI